MSNTQRTRAPRTNPARAEALGEGIEIEFDGATYTVPPSNQWSLDAIEAAENGRVIAATRGILGPDQWAKFRKAHNSLGDLERFMEVMQDVSGGNL